MNDLPCFIIHLGLVGGACICYLCPVCQTFYTASNGRMVACTNKLEPTGVYAQVCSYFRHGIDVHAGNVVVDIGANVGLFSLEAAQFGDRRIQLIACAPAPDLVAALDKNLTRYLRGTATALQVAVWRTSEPVSFTYYPNLTVVSSAYGSGVQDVRNRAAMEAMIVEEMPPRLAWVNRLPPMLRRFVIGRALATMFWPVRLTVPGVTLSQLIREHALPVIDLLKIDVERAELDVINGIEAPNWPRIRQLVIEVHDIDQRVTEMGDRLKALGYQVHVDQEVKMRKFDVYQLYARRQWRLSSDRYRDRQEWRR